MHNKTLVLLALFAAITTPFCAQGAEPWPGTAEITIRAERPWPNDRLLSDRDFTPAVNGDLGATLTQQAGIAAIRRGATAEEPLLRGLQRDNLAVTIDGQRLYGACPSHMDPTTFHIDADQIAEIEIVKGPYDLSQPGGGLGGAIDVRSAAPQPGLHGQLRFGLGSFATRNGGTELAYGGEQGDIAAGYLRRQAAVPEDGHGRKLTAIHGSTSPQRYRDPAARLAYDSDSHWLTIGTTRPGGSRLQLSYAGQDGGTTLYPYLKMDAVSDRTRRLALAGNWLQPNRWIDELSLRLYQNEVDHLMDDSLRASSQPSMMVTRPYMMRSDATTAVHGAALAATSRRAATSWHSGLDYSLREWTIVNRRAAYTTMQPYTPLAMIPAVESANLGGFLAAQQSLSDTVRLKGGVRYDLTHVASKASNSVSSGRPERSFAEVAANLQGAWQPSPALELFGGVARGTRPPDPQELYIDLPAAPPAASWRGNPALAATVNHQADAGFRYVGETLDLNLALFHSRLYDYITLAATTPTTKSYRNVAATLRGGELSGRVTLPGHLAARASLAYVRGENLTDRRPLAEIPPLLARLALRYEHAGFACEVRETMADRQRRIDPALNEQASAGWATTDLGVELSRGPLTFRVGIDNLFDKYYATHLSYLRDPFVGSTSTKVPEPGRYLYANLAYAF